MALVKYLSTTLVESFTSLSDNPTVPVASFSLSDLTILYIPSLEA